MVKKTLKKKVQAKSTASKLTDTVADSAREIWLAGLGAFAVAQQESGKLIEQGNKLFDRLVDEGAKLEKSTRGEAESKVVEIRGDVGSRVDSVRKQAADNWDKLEHIFEDRVARVLGRLGVPTADDVNRLSERVQKLSGQVTALNRKMDKSAASKSAKPSAGKSAGGKAGATKKKATTK